MTRAKPILVGLLLSASCAPITLSTEVDDLQRSTAAVTASMKALEREGRDASAADGRAAVLAQLPTATAVRYADTCSDEAAKARAAFDATAGAEPYDSAKVDAAYRRFSFVPLCDLAGTTDPDLPASEASVAELLPASGSIAGPGAVGAETLDSAATALEGYVDALADLTTNEAGARRDAARDEVFAAGGALLAAVGLPLATPISGVLGEVVASIEAARRNRRMAEYLTAYNRAMPHIMERLGHAARLTAAQAIESRASAASILAEAANKGLAGALPSDTGARVLLFEAYDVRIQAENGKLMKLRASDPMGAARAFAAAHDELRRAFLSSKATRASLATGLDRFRAAATELADAIGEGDRK